MSVRAYGMDAPCRRRGHVIVVRRRRPGRGAPPASTHRIRHSMASSWSSGTSPAKAPRTWTDTGRTAPERSSDATSTARGSASPRVPTALIGKVLGEDGADSDVIVTAIEWALRNAAQVISMSVGIDFPGMVVDLEHEGVPTELATSMALEGYRANILLFERLGSLVQARASFAGPCLLVAAAGNESRRDEDPDFVIAVVLLRRPTAWSQSRRSGRIPMVSRSRASPTMARACPGPESISCRRGRRRVDDDERNQHGYAARCRGRRLWAEKLMKSGHFSQQRFTDLLGGSAITASLKPGYSPADVGNGIVQAPQD